MSSIKSMIGHTMGAASAIEAAVCALAVAEDRIPPTMNLERSGGATSTSCPTWRASCRVRLAMNNAYAFGGNNASVILRKVEALSACGRRVVVTGAGCHLPARRIRPPGSTPRSARGGAASRPIELFPTEG